MEKYKCCCFHGFPLKSYSDLPIDELAKGAYTSYYLHLGFAEEKDKKPCNLLNLMGFLIKL